MKTTPSPSVRALCLHVRLPLVLLAALLFGGCAGGHPMGLNDAQWQALTPTQQAEYQAQQYQLNEQARRQAAQDAADRERAERERLAALRSSARYGDAISVTISGGEMIFFSKGSAYEPVAFDLVRGESREVEFVQQGRPMVRAGATVSLSEDGRTFTMDDGQLHRTVLVDDGWEQGRTYSTDRGATIRIRFKELAGAPHRIIIEKR